MLQTGLAVLVKKSTCIFRTDSRKAVCSDDPGSALWLFLPRLATGEPLTLCTRCVWASNDRKKFDLGRQTSVPRRHTPPGELSVSSRAQSSDLSAIGGSVFDALVRCEERTRHARDDH